MVQKTKNVPKENGTDVSKTTVTLHESCFCRNPDCKGRANNDGKAVRLLEKTVTVSGEVSGPLTQVCPWCGTVNRVKNETADEYHRRQDYWKKRYAEERAQQGS